MIDQGQITKEEGLTHPKKNIITRASWNRPERASGRDRNTHQTR